jgi:DNA-binding PadR family transcriptional regulator
MDEKRTTGKTDAAAEKVIATISRLGEATAAAIAAAAEVAYSTTNKKLRALEAEGLAEAFKGEDTRTLWRLTPAGIAAQEPERVGSNAAAVTADQHRPVAAQPQPHEHRDAVITDVDESGGSEPAAPPESDDKPQPEPQPDQPSMSEADTDPGAPHPAPHPANGADTGPTAHGEPLAGQVDADKFPAADAEAAGTADEQHPIGGPTGVAPPTGEDPAVGGEPATTGRRQPANPKRPKGTLRGAVLKLLQGNAGTAYKVGEICKLLDQSGEGSGVNKVSAGAVANALDKLVGDGRVTCVNDKPATFQAA